VIADTLVVGAISEGMVLGSMGADVVLLSAALIVVSLVDVGARGGDGFSIAGALRERRGEGIARGLQLLVITTVLGVAASVLTIWSEFASIRVAVVALTLAAVVEFAILTLGTLSLIRSGRP
jgi:hypothetical protein